jgi:hypothetical protein
MADRIQLTQEAYFKVSGQWQIVAPGSVVDVPTASAFASSQVTNVQLGTGSLFGGVHANPVSNFRARQ